MSGIKLLDNKFVMPPEFDLSIIENLPIHKHFYGMLMEETPTNIYWTEYQPTYSGTGTISFARKLYLEYPEVAEHVCKYLKNLFPRIPFDINRVNLLKTKGSIQPHLDESNRMTSINIGIKNSSIAKTRVSSVKDEAEFKDNAVEIVCQDNCAYLLDTSSYHEVISTDDTVSRYLFTYGFGVSYDIILREFKFKV
jgi:hypothetical protein